MVFATSLFSQLLSLIPRNYFHRAVRDHGAERVASRFGTKKISGKSCCSPITPNSELPPSRRFIRTDGKSRYFSRPSKKICPSKPLWAQRQTPCPSGFGQHWSLFYCWKYWSFEDATAGQCQTWSPCRDGTSLPLGICGHGWIIPLKPRHDRRIKSNWPCRFQLLDSMHHSKETTSTVDRQNPSKKDNDLRGSYDKLGLFWTAMIC